MHRLAAAVCLAFPLIDEGATAQATSAAESAQQNEHGKRIFYGLDAVSATVQQNGTTLPTNASKCINCHSAQTPPGAWTGSSQYLSATTMTRMVSRRGGPASVYDQDKFCNAVRNGVDPAGVVLESKMPRYEMSDTQCADMWLFISGIR